MAMDWMDGKEVVEWKEVKGGGGVEGMVTCGAIEDSWTEI